MGEMKHTVRGDAQEGTKRGDNPRDRLLGSAHASSTPPISLDVSKIDFFTGK